MKEGQIVRITGEGFISTGKLARIIEVRSLEEQKAGLYPYLVRAEDAPNYSCPLPLRADELEAVD